MRIFVKGFGCPSSLADTEVMAGCLLEVGHVLVSDPHYADLLIYNTCAVKGPTEDRIIHLLKKTSRDKKLIVAGCLPLINFERLVKEVRFDGLVGPASGEKIVDAVRDVSSGSYVMRVEKPASNMPQLNLPRLHINPEISIIPISYGCLGSCSYCCVRFARGKLRSYSIEDIVERVKYDLKEGVREFWFTSQDTASYGFDIGVNLYQLINEVSSLPGDFLIRIGMMTPSNLDSIVDQLVDAFHSGKVFKFIHIPVQSGDNGILRLMNRPYTYEDFIDLVKHLRKNFPRLTLATDVIVGFPEETEAAFKNTCKLIKEVRPDIVNVSKFFARPKTSARNLKNRVPPLEIKRRSAHLAEITHTVSLKRNSLWKNWSGRILIDELGKTNTVVGRNPSYKPIAIESTNRLELLGQFIFVRVKKILHSCLLGEIS